MAKTTATAIATNGSFILDRRFEDDDGKLDQRDDLHQRYLGGVPPGLDDLAQLVSGFLPLIHYSLPPRK